MQKLNVIFVLIATVVCIVICDAGKINESQIYRPCGCNNQGIDLECVKKYVSEHSEYSCSMVDDVDDSPYFGHHVPFYLPSLNLTVIRKKGYYTSYDGDIEEFYLDTKTGNFVISVNFKNGVQSEAKETYFVMNQRGKEPKVIVEYVKASFPTILTAIIPASDGMSIDSLLKATYTAYFTKIDGKYNIGPKFTESDDPDISSTYQALISNMETVQQEIFRTQACYNFLAFLQRSICDYGVAISDIVKRYDTTILDNIIDFDIDDEGYFERPCDDSDDFLGCVLNYFEKEGDCSVVWMPNDEPVYREVLTTYAPRINMKTIVKNANISQLNGTIEEFYINRQTENLVMSVRFDGIVMDTPEAHMILHKRGEEPKEIVDSYRDTYPVVLTAVIPISNGLTYEAMDKCLVSAYFPYYYVNYEAGPVLKSSKDPDVLAFLKVLYDEPMTNAKELFLTEARSLFRAYLQNHICDFDLPISSEF